MSHLGIDIGGNSAKIALVEGPRVLLTGRSDAYSRPNREQLIAALRQAAGGEAIEASGVGLCVPGLLDPSERKITLSVNVPGLVGIDLQELVLAGVGKAIPVEAIVSDALAAAFDIWLTRRMSGRLLVLCLGTGVGAAVLDDGRPLNVDGDSPGHLGQMDVSLAGEPVIGPDGGAGSLEGYIGLPALTQRYGADIPAAIEAWKGDEPPFLALARAMRIAHAIYRPHHIVLAGGVGIQLEPLLRRLKAQVSTNLTSAARPGWTLSAGDSPFHAAIGAAKYAAAQV